MVLMFDLTERHDMVRKMTDEEFGHFQELNKKYVKAWNEAEVYLRKMVEKYIDNPNTISVPANQLEGVSKNGKKRLS